MPGPVSRGLLTAVTSAGGTCLTVNAIGSDEATQPGSDSSTTTTSYARPELATFTASAARSWQPGCSGSSETLRVSEPRKSFSEAFWARLRTASRFSQ